MPMDEHIMRFRPDDEDTYRCTPLHSKQKTLPKETDAHCGFFIPQSQQTVLPGNALTMAWSFALICTMLIHGVARRTELLYNRNELFKKGCAEKALPMIGSSFTATNANNILLFKQSPFVERLFFKRRWCRYTPREE